MADFVVRGIDAEKYRRFRAVLVGRDETLGEWLEKRMDETVEALPFKIATDVELDEG